MSLSCWEYSRFTTLISQLRHHSGYMKRTLKSFLILSVLLWATKSSKPINNTMLWNTLSNKRCKCTSEMVSSGTATIKRTLKIKIWLFCIIPILRNAMKNIKKLKKKWSNFCDTYCGTPSIVVCSLLILLKAM